MMRVVPFFLAFGLATALDNGLAITPQMGWVCLFIPFLSVSLTSNARIPGTRLGVALVKTFSCLLADY